LIRPTALKRAAGLGVFRIWVSGRRPNLRAFCHCWRWPSVCKSSRGWHRPSGLARWWWTKLLPSGIHFHLNQPLTANCQ
jgi:hypothetical protein